ncbi:MAG TPA: HAD-IIIA family hydrolase [Pedobacter sp.]|uniref:D-glycero-alpha-D-manno-heptose-1,7-bisphosphate 7-phosphatase n=1 Tax=Pedobacter sp. TaxID=1411316 RepID=UPI002BB7C326|nr:HAD-IIIA family hydrolase [Pedobacter sp.]HMI01433.1 HAD-IIIA family hydrolase [Pedobacter sp.]
MAFDTLFLDRDGVLNRKIDAGYVLKVTDVELLPGMHDFLIWASPVFKQIIVVTNQRCVGRGLITQKELVLINAHINAEMGNLISCFFVCPHLTEEECNCRKPNQGLFLAATEEYTIDFRNSWMIGDSETDLIPAKALGIRSVYISNVGSRYADVTVESTSDLQDVFLKIIAGTIPVDIAAR